MTYALDSQSQVNAYDAYVNDPRGVVPTGYTELDALLRKGGMGVQTLVLLGGRTRTRKTTVTGNLIVNMLEQGYNVGLVGLDGSLSNNYIGRMFSTWSGLSMDVIEGTWNHEEKMDLKERYIDWCERFTVYNGPLRPSTADLTQYMLEAELAGSRPQVVFIDYISLLVRNKYENAENQRIHRLIEDLQVWTSKSEVVTIALHQVGRLDEGVGLRYHGDTPLSLEGLKYGGEEIADIVLSTYRPSLDPIGNMTWDSASQFKGDKFTKDQWHDAVERVEKYRDYTFIQLLKNRPGTHTHEQGLPLRSHGESMKMNIDFDVLAPGSLADPGDILKAGI